MGDARKPSPTSTFELLQQMVAGDHQAREVLADRIMGLLQRAARLHGLRDELPNHIDLDDIINEVWASVLDGRGLTDFRDERVGALRTFMLSVLDRRMIDACRRGQRQPDNFELDGTGREPSAELSTSREEVSTSEVRAARLWELLERLLGERDLALLRGAAEGLHAKDLAARLRLSEEAAQRALTRAKQRARNLLFDI